jgi:hypothetical protein
VSLIALDAEVPACERLYDASLNLNEIVSCHSSPFRRILARHVRPVNDDGTRRGTAGFL